MEAELTPKSVTFPAGSGRAHAKAAPHPHPELCGNGFIIPQFRPMYKRSRRFYTFVLPFLGVYSFTQSMRRDDTVTVTSENAMRRTGM